MGHFHKTCRAKVKILTKAKSPIKNMAKEIETSMVATPQRDQQIVLDTLGASVAAVETAKEIEPLSRTVASAESAKETEIRILTTEHQDTEKGTEREDVG